MSKKLSKEDKLAMKVSQSLHDELSEQLFGKPESLLNITEQTKLDRYINDYLHPIWKVITTKHGYRVEVSNVGQVRDPITKKPYKIYYAKDGKYGFIYIPTSITGGKICIEHVHVLVAMAFCNNPENKTDVNHINANKRCNWWENLEWVTPKENVEHAIANGLINNVLKYTTDQIRNVCNDIVNCPTKSLKKIAEENGVSEDIVELINARKAWKSISEDYTFPDRSGNVAHNGESNGNSKYTEELINEMCNMFDDVHTGKSNLSLKEIANKLHVPLTLVRDVYRGKSWRCVSANHVFRTGQTTPSKGEDSPVSIYTNEQVRHVCQLLQDHPDLPYEDIEKLTGVDWTEIGCIYRGERWQHISKDYTFPPRNTKASGENNGSAKYTEDQITHACQLLDKVYNGKLKATQQQIADECGISRKTVQHILAGEAWTYIAKNYDFYGNKK